MEKKIKIHFIGIGGIGVSALAQFYQAKGHIVSGSDLATSKTIEYLKSLGIKIYIGEHKPENLSLDVDLVIYSPAVRAENPELHKAHLMQTENHSLKVQSYPESLGDLTKQYFTIAVSGSHGKSTTSAMISLLLIKAGLNPTVIIGTKLKEFLAPESEESEGTNFKMGSSGLLVIEADEHFASFLNYWPKIVVLTNIEEEHLDFYKNINNILKTYKEYISHLPKDGFLVANKDDKNIKKILKDFEAKKVFYSAKQKEVLKVKKALKVPGKHNVMNALAVLEVAKILAIDNKITLQALSEFNGSWRRFEEKMGSANGKKITIISDYGHHPTEVLATLEAAREKYKANNIWCVFQPHQKQRTYYLQKEFVKAFRKAPIDNILITDIYDVAGREEEQISSKITSQKLVKKINKKHINYMPLPGIENFVKENIKPGDVLVIMGAGDIYNLAEKF